MDIKPTAIDTQTSMMLGQHNSKSKEDLKQVAEQFEAIFVDMFLKEARKGELAESLFSNQASETFQSMLDQEYSKLMAQKTGLGIAEALYKQFKDHVGGDE